MGQKYIGVVVSGIYANLKQGQIHSDNIFVTFNNSKIVISKSKMYQNIDGLIFDTHFDLLGVLLYVQKIVQ